MDTEIVNIAVIILTMNQRERTLQCLTSLQGIESPPFETILWDNGSQDGTAEAVRAEFPQVLVHHHPSNLGAAAGRNAAAELAIRTIQPSYLLFIDNDMTVTPGFLDALLEPFEGDSRLAQTTGKIRFPNEERRLNDAGGCNIQFWLGRTSPVGYGEIDHGQYDQPTKCIPGGFTLVRTDVFQQVGGLDPLFDPYGYEDLDFSLRIRKAGYHALYMPQALAFHDVSQTFEAGQYTEKYARHKARNWFLFMRRHASLMEKVAFFLVGVPYLAGRTVIREGRKGNLGAFRGLVRGMLDFYKSSLHSKG